MFEVFYSDGNRKLFEAPSMLELIKYLLASDLAENVYKIAKR